MNKKYQSEAMQVIHEDMKGMHQLGIISDERMSEFDEMCLTQESKASKPETPAITEHLSRKTASGL